MALVSRIQLSEEEKLDLLQRLDGFRVWDTLDDERYCLVCGKVITGRQIEVIGGTRGYGPLHIICPTEHCNSMPVDWVRATDKVIIKIARAEIAMVEGERRGGRGNIGADGQ